MTGSCLLVESSRARFLADCGMFQGAALAAARHLAGYGFEPPAIDFVLLTHAHLDRSGRLPGLTRDGFRGPVYATEETLGLLPVLLSESAHIQRAEADRATTELRESGRSEHAEPLYTQGDVEAALARARPVVYDRPFSPAPGVTVTFRAAGHIPGSAFLEIDVEDAGPRGRIVVSGALGDPGYPAPRPAARAEEADLLVLDSTYGDRDHRGLAETLEELALAVRGTLEVKRGNVLIPSFAAGQGQQVLHFLHRLSQDGCLLDLDVYLDSPVAAAAAEMTVRDLGRLHRQVGPPEPGAAVPPPRLHVVQTAEESTALGDLGSGAVILSASGMCDAGRIQQHLRRELPRRESTVILTDCQAQGTPGRALVDGATTVRLLGEEIPVRAGIHTLNALSGHAGRTALLEWVGAFRRPPLRTLVVHGEARAAYALARALKERGHDARVPHHGQVVPV